MAMRLPDSLVLNKEQIVQCGEGVSDHKALHVLRQQLDKIAVRQSVVFTEHYKY
jgi:hypothetical protein